MIVVYLFDKATVRIRSANDSGDVVEAPMQSILSLDMALRFVQIRKMEEKQLLQGT
jgi:hypothetical protein